MSAELDQILITSSGPDWHGRLRQIHASVREATYFEDGSDEDRLLNEILCGVKTRKEAAVQE